MTNNPHICTCGDCVVDYYVDECKYEKEVKEMRAAAWELHRACFDAGGPVVPRVVADAINAITRRWGTGGQPI
jgi:hypothetical protein